MAKEMIVPSQFYFVPQETSIKKCLQIMKEKSLSFLLINDQAGKLKGIFTLKDLVNRFDFLKNHVTEPVKKVMSYPVKTLPANKIHKAVETMVKSNIRHLPITTGSRGENKVIGVVDMESMLKSSRAKKSKKDESLNISMYSPRGNMRRLMQKSFANDKLVRMAHLRKGPIDPDHITKHVSQFDVLIFDLVDSEEFPMARALAEEVLAQQKRMVIIVTREVFLTNSERKALEKLGESEPILVMDRPFEGHDILKSAMIS